MKNNNRDSYLSHLLVRWPRRVSYIHRTWEEFLQFRNLIIEKRPTLEAELPVLNKLAMSVYTSSHSTEIAETRKNAISEMLQFVESNSSARDSSATITFLYEDEKTLPTGMHPSLERADSMPIAHGGKIKMNLTIVDETTVRILIEHCQDLPTLEDSHTAPEPYVKIYLTKGFERISESKRKTTISHRTCHPTFNQVIDYVQIENVKDLSIEISVWSYLISGNVPLGKVELKLDQNHRGWFPLEPKWR